MSYPVFNPARPSEVVLEAPEATPEQLDAVVEAARRAQPDWAALPLEERVERVTAAAEAGSRAAVEAGLAAALTREHGKVRAESEFELATVGLMGPTLAGFAGEALAPGHTGSSEVTHEPFGVVAAILPFNWPVSVLAMKALPALLAGNAVVAKAPPTCPGAVLAVTEAMAAELPPGLLAAVSGPGPELGEALIAHPGISMVSFTGGVATGKRVMAAAGARLVPVLLELGGNDPAVLGPDLEVDEALAGRLWESTFLTSGQVCMAIKRLYAPEGRVGEVVEALVARGESEVVGDGLAEGVTMGPVHTRRSREFVEGLLAEAESAGAKVHRTGRLRPEDADSGGYFVLPAVVEGAPPTSRIVREEQFAPALPVLPYRDLDDAVAQANDTEYGLCASVWTGDDALAAEVSRRLEAGVVWVNHHGISAVDPAAPFGGWKESGIGRELGPDGIGAYTRTRALTRHPLPT